MVLLHIFEVTSWEIPHQNMFLRITLKTLYEILRLKSVPRKVKLALLDRVR